VNPRHNERYLSIARSERHCADNCCVLVGNGRIDTSFEIHAGTAFTVPADWTARNLEKIVILEPNEFDMTLAIIEVEAKDASSAMIAAWLASIGPAAHDGCGPRRLVRRIFQAVTHAFPFSGGFLFS
jgi:hypothetical protein